MNSCFFWLVKYTIKRVLLYLFNKCKKYPLIRLEIHSCSVLTACFT